MVKSKSFRNSIVAGLLVLFTVAALWAQSSARPANDELLRLVPAESLFCVRINNFDYTFSRIDQFLAGISPMPGGVSVVVRTTLAQLLGSPDLKGVNTAASFAVFGTLAPGESIGDHLISVLIPVTDYELFVSGNANVGQPDANGVSKITGEGGVVMRVGNFALLKSPGSYDRLVAMAKSVSAKSATLAGTLAPAEARRAVEKPIWLYGNIQQVSKTFGPMIFGKIEEMKKMLQQVKAGTPGSPPGNIQNIMNMYVGILKTLMNETKTLTIAINPKPDVLNITETISAVPGTDMASMFVADPAAGRGNKLLGYLEDGAMMNFAARMNAPCCKKFYDKFFDLFAPIFGDTITAEDIAKMKKLTADAIDSLAGPVAVSFSTEAKHKSLFALKYVVEVKDANKFDKVIRENIQMWNGQTFAGFYKSMAMESSCTFKQAADTYRGISISSAKLVIKSTDPNSPQAKMLAAMYGEGLEYRWALVDGLCVFAIGGDADSAVRTLIDLVQAGGPKQIGSETKAALALLPDADKADFMGTFNYVRMLKILPPMMGTMLPAPMPQVDIPTKSNFVFAGNVGSGSVTIDIAIPKTHLVEIIAAFRMMMQHQMQQQMKMQPTPMPGQSTIRPADLNKTRVTITKANLRGLHQAVVQFKMDTGRYPTEEEGLMALIKKPPGVANYNSGGYLDSTQLPKDAWGRNFIYRLFPESGKPFVIVSYGADGKEGGQGYDADLRSTDAY